MYGQGFGSSVPEQTMKALNKLVVAHRELGIFGDGGFDLAMESLVAEWLLNYKKQTNAREKRYVLPGCRSVLNMEQQHPSLAVMHGGCADSTTMWVQG
jgi:hypothetical protein